MVTTLDYQALLLLALVCMKTWAITCYKNVGIVIIKEECRPQVEHCFNVTSFQNNGYGCGYPGLKKHGCGTAEEIYGNSSSIFFNNKGNQTTNAKVRTCACNDTDLCNAKPDHLALRCYQTQQNGTVLPKPCHWSAKYCSTMFGNHTSGQHFEKFQCGQIKIEKMGCGMFEEMHPKEKMIEYTQRKPANNDVDLNKVKVCACETDLCNQPKPIKKQNLKMRAGEVKEANITEVHTDNNTNTTTTMPISATTKAANKIPPFATAIAAVQALLVIFKP